MSIPREIFRKVLIRPCANYGFISVRVLRENLGNFVMTMNLFFRYYLDLGNWLSSSIVGFMRMVTICPGNFTGLDVFCRAAGEGAWGVARRDGIFCFGRLAS